MHMVRAQTCTWCWNWGGGGWIVSCDIQPFLPLKRCFLSSFAHNSQKQLLHHCQTFFLSSWEAKVMRRWAINYISALLFKSSLLTTIVPYLAPVINNNDSHRLLLFLFQRRSKCSVQRDEHLIMKHQRSGWRIMLSLCSNLLLLITLVQQESGKKKKNTFILTLLFLLRYIHQCIIWGFVVCY